MPILKTAEQRLEHLLFTSRWLMAPVYFGLTLALLVLLLKFGKEAWHLLVNVFTASSADLIVGVLSLIDVALIMGLVLIVMFSGYENFVSKMEDLHGHTDCPEWMGHISFGDLKLKVMGSIVAISGIELLKAFLHLGTQHGAAGAEALSHANLGWMVGIHLTFVLSGLLYAVTERVQGHR